MNKKKPVKFSFGGDSDFEDEDVELGLTKPTIGILKRPKSPITISISEPTSPQLLPSAPIITEPESSSGTSHSRSKSSNVLSNLNPSSSTNLHNSNQSNLAIGNNGGGGGSSSPMRLLNLPKPQFSSPLHLDATAIPLKEGEVDPYKERTEPNVIVVDDINHDIEKMEARQIVRNLTKKAQAKDNGNGAKRSILANLLQLHNQANKQHRGGENSGGNTTPIQSPSNKPNRKSYFPTTLTPNLSSQSLSNFFGIGSGRSSMSDDGTTLNSSHERKVAAAIASILKRQKFITNLAQAFIMYGAPSHRLESNLITVARILDIEASFASLPGLMLINFGDLDTHTSETILLRVTNGYNLHKLDLTVKIYQAIVKKDLNLDTASTQLTEILEAQILYPPWLDILGYGLGSFAAAPLLFQGSWLDAAVAGVLGLCVGFMTVLAKRFPNYGNIFELSAAILSAFIATALHNYVCYWSVVLASVVNLLPGLSLTTAVVELASKNMVSGAVRMFYALLIAFLLGFGLSLGIRLYTSFDPTGLQSVQCQPINPYFNFLLFPLVSISFNIYLFAHPRQWLSMSTIAACGYLVSTFLPPHVSQDIIPAISAFVVGFLSNLYARITNTLPVVPLLSSVLMLVPGSLGVKGSSALLTAKSAEGADFALKMIVVALSITVGLFVSTLIVFPLGRRRSAFMTF